MRKKVILYIRVSTDEQALGYSLKGQEAHLRNFCKIKGWDVVAIFQDDYTAWKGFDRPAYTELNKYLNANKGSVNYLLFTQWSRFSRHTSESYSEIDRLKTLKIEANAAEQWIDYSVPENLYMLAFYLSAPQVENDRLSLRVKAGNRQAIMEGRFLSKAPYGYINKDKYLIVDIEKAAIVKYCFEAVAKGNFSCLEEVRRSAKEKSLPLNKQSFLDLLKNYIYIGKLRLPAYKEEPERLVPGIHEAIIEESLFEQVQLILSGKRKPYKGITKHGNLPLIGHIICPKCGKPLTGSVAKGNGGHYPYYHCQRKYGCNQSVSANHANQEFFLYIQTLEVKPEILDLYVEVLNEKFILNTSQIEIEKKNLESQIDLIDKNIVSLEEKYIFQNSITDEVYQKYRTKLATEKSDLVMKHATLVKMPNEFTKYMRFGLTLLNNLSTFYKNAEISIKKKIVGSIFPEKLRFVDNSYQTTKMNSVFALVIATTKASIKKQSSKIAGLSTNALPSGLEPETL